MASNNINEYITHLMVQRTESEYLTVNAHFNTLLIWQYIL